MCVTLVESFSYALKLKYYSYEAAVYKCFYFIVRNSYIDGLLC